MYLFPSRSEELVRIGLISWKDKKYSKALHYYKLAADEDEYNEQAWIGQAVIHELYDSYEESIRCSQNAININPTNPDSHVNIAICYSELGYHEEAIKHLLKAIKLEPENHENYAMLAYIYNQNKDFTKTKEYAIMADRLMEKTLSKKSGTKYKIRSSS